MSLEGVTYAYPLAPVGEPAALRGLSIAVDEGEIICIAGRNGSGKSTLAQICAGLLVPSGGEIRYEDEPVASRSDRLSLRRKVGLLFQSAEDQLFADTVEKDIAFGPRNLGIRGEQLGSRVKKATSLVGLAAEDVLPRSPFSLSQGEQRRVALAGVLAMEPRLLILDEPFIGLDSDGKTLLGRALKQYRDSHDCSVVMVTHELSEAWKLSDRFALLANGKLAEVRSKSELLLDGELLESLGLHLPQWAELAATLQRRGLKLEDPASPACLAAALKSVLGGQR